MKTYLVTFGLDSIYRDKCVIVTAESEQRARDYVFGRYGRLNVAYFYDYDEKRNLIDRYKYKVMENITLYD